MKINVPKGAVYIHLEKVVLNQSIAGNQVLLSVSQSKRIGHLESHTFPCLHSIFSPAFHVGLIGYYLYVHGFKTIEVNLSQSGAYPLQATLQYSFS